MTRFLLRVIKMHLLPQAFPAGRSRGTFLPLFAQADATVHELCQRNLAPSIAATRPYSSPIPDPASAIVFDFYGLAFEDAGCRVMRVKEGWECAGTGRGEDIEQTVRSKIQF
jgi:hypothetical protein